MPNLVITTNLPSASIPPTFVLNILPVLALAMNRSEELLFVTVTPDAYQVFNKDATTPVVVATLSSVGQIGPDENKVTALALTDFIEKELGVPRDRILISFYNMDPSNVARAGNTFA